MNGSSVLRNYPRNCTMPWNEANRDTESWCVSVTADSAREMISTEQNWWRSGRLLRNGRPFEAAAVACRLWLWPDRQAPNRTDKIGRASCRERVECWV